MTVLIAVIPDFFIVAGAAFFAARCFTFSRSLKEGYTARNFIIIGIASVLLAFAELGHLAADAGVYPVGELLHDIIEAVFVIILVIGVSKFFPAWMPKNGRHG